MWDRLIGVGLGVSLAIMAAFLALGPLTTALAQRSQPNLSPDDQLAPSQMVQPMPGAVAEPAAPPPVSPPKPAPKPQPTHAAASSAPASPAPANPPPAAAAPPSPAPASPARAGAAKPSHTAGVRTVVECSGPFAKNSGMLALAMIYDSRNMIFTQETVPGGEANITVLFPDDPQRRLEVWWSNSNRTGTYLIDIANKSIWTGPSGLRLGLNLEQLEKLNHKPFKLKGFDSDDVARVSSWDDGALASLAGGCKAGVNLHASAPAAAAELPAKGDYSSNDPAMRALNPTVSEILIGY
jgi:hypothetical protein